MNDLPIELLRTFVATVDRGSMARAAQLARRTPSAVSLQMSKLGGLVGQPLFQRHGRSQVLARAGQTLLGCAREILEASDRATAALSKNRIEGPVRFGAVQDLADTLLPHALAEFAKQNPAITLHVEVGSSALLLDEARAGDLDFVLCFQSRRAPRVIRREPGVWLGHRSLASRDPVPIAVLEPSCSLCETGIQALERAGRRYNVVVRTPSLSGLRAALEAGLAIGSRTPLLRSGAIEILGEAERLPPLPEVGFALQIPRALNPAARRVASLVRQVIARDETPSAAPMAPMRAAS